MNPSIENDIQEMVRKGATRGMVKISLKEQGISAAEIDRVFDMAIKAKATQARGKGLLWVIGGFTLIIANWIAISLLFAGNQGVAARVPVVLMGVGAWLIFKGVVTMVSGVDDEE